MHPTQASMETMHHPHKHILQIVMVFILVLVGIIFAVLFNSRMASYQPQPNLTSRNISPTPVFNENSPWMKVVNNATQQKTVGDQVTFTVQANSSGKNITAFDALLTYNPDSLDIIDVSAGMKEFQIVAFKKVGFISVTGTKSLSITSPTPLSQSPVIVVKAKIKKVGRVTLSIEKKIRNETTKMIDAKSNQIIPQLQSGTLEIY